MLDLLYIGLVVLPLTIAAAALLLLAWRGVRSQRGAAEPIDVRQVGRAVLDSLGPDPEADARIEARPAAPAPLGPRPTLADLSAMVESRAAPPPMPLPLPAAPTVGAPRAATKVCPDCAEEVLAAARVCKHCRYRFDEPDWGAGGGHVAAGGGSPF